MSLQQDQFMNLVKEVYNGLMKEFSAEQLAFAGLYLLMQQDLAHVQDIRRDDSIDVLPKESVDELLDSDFSVDEYTGSCPMLAELINQASR